MASCAGSDSVVALQPGSCTRCGTGASSAWQLRFQGEGDDRAVRELGIDGLPGEPLDVLAVFDGEHEVFRFESIVDGRGQRLSAGDMMTAIGLYGGSGAAMTLDIAHAAVPLSRLSVLFELRALPPLDDALQVFARLA